MMEKLKNADMIVFNRCTEETRAALRARNLKMVNRRADIFLENMDGSSEDYADETVSAFDLSAPVIDVSDEDYGIFYVEAMDLPQRFDGKTPCAVNGQCGDCTSPDCICSQMVITRFCKPAGRIKVVLVGEELGL